MKQSTRLCLFITFSVVGTVFAEHPINQDLIDHVRRSTDLWEPTEISENIFTQYTEEEINNLFKDIPNEPVPPDNVELKADATFDSRTKWPKCKQTPRDQQKCGAGSAFSATGALQFRACIQTSAVSNPSLSPQILISCQSTINQCNNGTLLNNTYDYLTKTGTSVEACFPYTSGNLAIPACPSVCKDKSAIKRYKCKASSTLVANGATAIQNLIQSSGPVSSTMTVYADFLTYKTGIYNRTSTVVRGNQAVQIVGWGLSGTTKYWIAQNSYGTAWGETGYFRILFGVAGIDTTAFGCTYLAPAAEEVDDEIYFLSD